MPYNTRRKSLSLPSLGIQLPHGSRAHRSPPSKLSNTTEASQPPPTKKIKRSHPLTTSSPTSPSTRSTSTPSTADLALVHPPKSGGRVTFEHTPPPSPGATADAKIDTEGINDDIVTGVIEQLEKTGNRPHLIKELAAVLGTTSESVAGYVLRSMVKVVYLSVDMLTFSLIQVCESSSTSILPPLDLSASSLDRPRPMSARQRTHPRSPEKGVLLPHQHSKAGHTRQLR